MDNHIHHNCGDGIQFGHQAANTLGRFYIGRNHIHDNGEHSLNIKEASDVVTSENILHDEPEGTVVLHDCRRLDLQRGLRFGASMPSLEDACDEDRPVSLFVVGNEFHDIDENGVQGWGSGKRYFIAANSFTSVDTHIEVDPQEAGSEVSENDAAFEAAALAYQAAHDVDIRP